LVLWYGFGVGQFNGVIKMYPRVTLVVAMAPFELKIGTPVTPALGDVHATFSFSTHSFVLLPSKVQHIMVDKDFHFCFRVGSRIGQTDGQTDRQDLYCGLLGRPHNKT